MKRLVLIVGIVFAVALAVVLGNRMSTDATALVVGVACGVLASIPTSLLLVWALTRRTQIADSDEPRRAQFGPGSQYPPVVVVNPGQQPTRSGWGNAAPYPGGYEPVPSGPRAFNVVGEADTGGGDSSRPFWAD